VAKLVFWWCALLAVAAAQQARPRQCCRYAAKSGQGEENSPCWSGPEACLLANSSGPWSPDVAHCRVIEDTKRDAPVRGRGKCLEKNVDSADSDVVATRWLARPEGPPFRLVPYAFADNPSLTPLPAVAVELDYSATWGRDAFRLVDRTFCGNDDAARTQQCSPRCVEILRSHSAFNQPATKLIYDCEVGFVPAEGGSVLTTAGNVYEFTLCSVRKALTDDVGSPNINECASFYFVMPSATSAAKGRPLPVLDVAALQRDKDVVIHFPQGFLSSKDESDDLTVAVVDGESRSIVAERTIPASSSSFTLAFHEEDLALEPATYLVIVKGHYGEDEETVARFVVAEPDDDEGAALGGLLILLILLVLAMGMAFHAYRKADQWKKGNQVHPNWLIDSGRVAGKEIFVVTNVDKRQHIDVVLAPRSYLKKHCGGKEGHFSVDEQTGVYSPPQRDPWRWSQIVADKMAALPPSDAMLVFSAAPPVTMGRTVYKDLPNNQAFVSAKLLQTMSERGRVAVLHWPYSDAATVPLLIPPHVAADFLILPRQMNDFLCQLLEIGKRPLCSFLPCTRLIKPLVSGQY